MLILNSLIGSKQKKIKTVILLNKIYFVKTVCRRTIIFLFKNYIKMKGKKKKILLAQVEMGHVLWTALCAIV